MSKPELYNWVRAVSKITRISAIYSVLVISVCLVLGVLVYREHLNVAANHAPVLNIFAAILLTLGVRSIIVRKLKANFQSDFKYEVLLASWAILLILLHLECQLLGLMLSFQKTEALWLILGQLFIFTTIYLTWPRLTKIQNLLDRK